MDVDESELGDRTVDAGHDTDGIEPLTSLGVTSPLETAAGLLLDRTPDPLGEIDLSSVLVVTPGRRAGRQLLLAIDEAATTRGRRFVPPTFTTLAALDEFLATGTRPAVADDAAVLAAIAAAIGQAAVPDDDDPLRWLPQDPDPIERHALARRIHDADRVVRAGGSTWNAVEILATSRGGDGSRYRGIASVMADADEILGNFGLVRRDVAIETVIGDLQSSTGEVGSWREIVLVGVVDLGERDRRLLRAAARRGLMIRVFVIADADRIRGFDRFGAVVPAVWKESPPIVPMESIQLEVRPIDAAMAVVTWLEERQNEGGGRLDPDAVSLVLADESIGETIRRELQASGASVHLGQGRAPLSDGPARTLERLASWFERPDSSNLGVLLADPGIDSAVRSTSGVSSALSDWSSWAADQLPRPLGSGWLDAPESAPSVVRDRSARLSKVDSALADLLRSSSGPTHPDRLTTQVDVIVDLLARIDLAAGDASGWSDSSLRAVRTAAERLSGIPSELSPIVDLAQAIRMFLDTLRSVSQPDPAMTDSLETIGWLEGPFDPASRILIIALHDAAVPGSAEDQVLPDSIRCELGLESACRRSARDAWVLSTMLGRDPKLRVILPKEDAAGERLVPSRLLFGDGGAALARRVSHLFKEPVPRMATGTKCTAFQRMKPPENQGGIERPSMSVTEFRLHLQSPYRYWLRYGLGLKSEPPAGHELDARHFGTVMHAAVEAFGRHEIDRVKSGGSPLTDPDEILREMLDGMHAALDAVARGSTSPTLRLQTRICEERLRRVAAIQAARALEGWTIQEVEWTIDRELDMPDGRPQRVKGRIDRIDRHPQHGWMVIDFKTSESGDGPDKVHLASDGSWLDLQLPLYRWAVSQTPDHPPVDRIASAYFVVGGEAKGIGILQSKEIDGLFDEAMAKARDVVTEVRNGDFGAVGTARLFPDDPVGLLMRMAAVGSDEEGDG